MSTIPTPSNHPVQKPVGVRQRLPITACDRCGRPGHHAMEVKKRCESIVADKSCRGKIRLADTPDQWTECTSCRGTGWTGETCTRCDGFGWFFIRGRD